MQQIDTLPPHYLYRDSASLDSQVICAYDTIFTPIEPSEPVVRKSLFTHHSLAVTSSGETDIHHQGAPGWYFGFIVLSIFLTFIFLRSKQLRLVDLLMPSVNHRALDRLLRDTNLTRSSNQAPIAFLMLLPTTLIAYYTYGPTVSNVWTDITQYLLLLLGALIVYFFRNGIFRFLGSAFNNSESIHIYLSSNYLFHLLYAIVATAFAFFIIYTEYVSQTLLYILLGTLGFLFTIRLFRGLQLILTISKTPKLFLFYYLCILEIVPIFIVIKIVLSI